jgi:hypothetical protein
LLTGIAQSQDAPVRGMHSIDLFIVGHVALLALVVVRRWHRDDLDLWVWLLGALIAVAAGFRFFEHYWMQTLPPLCLLAAPAIDRCTDLGRRALFIAAATPVVIAWWAAWAPLPHTNAEPIAKAIDSQTRPNDRVTVWGSFPEIYWQSGRDPAGGVVVSDFLVGKAAGHRDGRATLSSATPGAVRDFMRSVRRHPPVLFIDTSTGDIRGYGRYPVKDVPQVRAWVLANFHPVARVDGVTIYRRDRRGPPPTWRLATAR